MLLRSDLIRLFSDVLVEVLTADRVDTPAVVDETTPLVGGAVIDSLGLVEVIMEAELRLRRDHGADVTLADERAMSQRHSPFRTIGTFADYAALLIAERRTLGQ